VPSPLRRDVWGLQKKIPVVDRDLLMNYTKCKLAPVFPCKKEIEIKIIN
jgi:hypothetical protein